jgi:hypothetical protein
LAAPKWASTAADWRLLVVPLPQLLSGSVMLLQVDDPWFMSQVRPLPRTGSVSV